MNRIISERPPAPAACIQVALEDNWHPKGHDEQVLSEMTVRITVSTFSSASFTGMTFTYRYVVNAPYRRDQG